MADAPFDDFRSAGILAEPSVLSRLIAIGAAVTTVSLVAGGAFWAYRIAVRDVSGVPVIRALEAPMRVAPEAPGGQVVPYSGLAVNAVPGGAAPDAGTGNLVLAPAPLALLPDDAPGLGTAPAAPGFEPEVVDPATESAAFASAPPERAGEAIGAPAADPAPVATPTAAAPEARLSFAPPPRPAGLGRPAAAAAPAAPAAALSGPSSGDDPVAAALASVLASLGPVAAPAEIDPASIAPGTRLVQVGSFDDIEAARRGWDGVAVRAGALITDKSRVIVPVDDGGRVFYRLRVAGFLSEDDARRFCAVVGTESQRCVPVIHR
jgi:hypothetical protein